MNGFLRFLGLINAAVWLGAAVFMLLGVEPASSSRRMLELLGQNNFPYFSVTIAELIQARFFRIYFVCGALAFAHLAAEWLYLGKYPARAWVVLLAGLCLLGILQAGMVHPGIGKHHQAQFSSRGRPEEQAAAAKSARLFKRVGVGVSWVTIGGLVLYLWRVGNPEDPMRFVSARQFRS